MSRRASVDLDGLMATPVHWEPDPGQEPRFRAQVGGEWVHLWLIPYFPDTPLWCLEVESVGLRRGLEELPDGWTRGPLEWPSTADTSRPQWMLDLEPEV